MNIRTHLLDEVRKKSLPLDDCIEKIKDECYEIIDIYENRKPLYRGIQTLGASDALYIEPRTNRKPLDTKVPVHKVLDRAFKEVFGWNARSEGVFASNSFSQAQFYGVPYIIFPKNRFKYLWSPKIGDLVAFGAEYIPTIDFIGKQRIEKLYFEWAHLTPGSRDPDKFRKWMADPKNFEYVCDIVEDNYKSTKIEDATYSEIMIKCSGYYAINSVHLGRMKEEHLIR